MPTLALALPSPAQSTGMVANLTWVKPTSSSLSVLVPIERVQLKASPWNGESLVPARLLGSAARSGSEVYFCSETRPNRRSRSDRLTSTFTSP